MGEKKISSLKCFLVLKMLYFIWPIKCELIKCDKGSLSLHRQDLVILGVFLAWLPIAPTDITPLVISI